MNKRREFFPFFLLADGMGLVRFRIFSIIERVFSVVGSIRGYKISAMLIKGTCNFLSPHSVSRLSQSLCKPPLHTEKFDPAIDPWLQPIQWKSSLNTRLKENIDITSPGFQPTDRPTLKLISHYETPRVTVIFVIRNVIKDFRMPETFVFSSVISNATKVELNGERNTAKQCFSLFSWQSIIPIA